MSPAPHLVVRAEGGPGIGSGHVARCFALTQAWLDAGGTASLVSARVPAEWAERYRREGADVVPHEHSSQAGDCVRATQAGDWTVLDGYHFTRADQEAVKAGGGRLLAVDDHGHLPDHVADLVLDQNLGADEAMYAGRSAGTDLLLGTQYALLRREFREQHGRPRIIAAEAQRLLVSVGGSPTAAVRDAFEDVLADDALRGLGVVRLSGVEDVGAAMARADLALAASGSTSWELCCTGLPAVLVSVAENQVRLAHAMAESGAAVDGGPLPGTDPGALAEQVARLARDPLRRAQMSAAGQVLVDGRGSRRVTSRLRAALLDLRRAAPGDARLLWEWANDPVVRSAGFREAPIPWEDHVDWLHARLADPDAAIYVAAGPDAKPVGVVRFERDGADAEISVAVVGDRRGQGWGAPLIIAGVLRLLREAPVDTVIARIKPENQASVSSFEDAAFVRTGEHQTGDVRWVSYALRRPVRQVVG